MESVLCGDDDARSLPAPRRYLLALQRQAVTDSTPLSEAEPYGDVLTHAKGHIDYWTELQERGAIPIEVEYEEPPRGRVGYDSKEERVLHAGRPLHH